VSLVVDDDRDIAELVQAALTDEGYEVTVLYDVTGERFQRALGQRPDDRRGVEGRDVSPEA
jgi:DNA-binding response OmpR family regulator